MMQGFEDVTFDWAGESYTVPADRQMMLVAKIEAELVGDTGKQAIEVLLQPSGPPHARLALAFEAALRYAGAAISHGEVYLSIMQDLANNDSASLQKMQMATLTLLSVVSPPIGHALREDAKPKKKQKAKA